MRRRSTGNSIKMRSCTELDIAGEKYFPSEFLFCLMTLRSSLHSDMPLQIASTQDVRVRMCRLYLCMTATPIEEKRWAGDIPLRLAATIVRAGKGIPRGRYSILASIAHVREHTIAGSLKNRFARSASKVNMHGQCQCKLSFFRPRVILSESGRFYNVRKDPGGLGGGRDLNI